MQFSRERLNQFRDPNTQKRQRLPVPLLVVILVLLGYGVWVMVMLTYCLSTNKCSGPPF